MSRHGWAVGWLPSDAAPRPAVVSAGSSPWLTELHEAAHFTTDRLSRLDHLVAVVSVVPDATSSGRVTADEGHATTVDRLRAKLAALASEEARRWAVEGHVVPLLAGGAAELEYGEAPADAPLPAGACHDEAQARALLGILNGRDPDAEVRRLVAYTRDVLRLPSVWRACLTLASHLFWHREVDAETARAIIDPHLGPLVGSLFRLGDAS